MAVFYRPTPTEWPVARDPERLLQLIPNHRRGNERRLRLYGCACARQVWHLLTTDARSAVRVSERFADGAAGPADLLAVGLRLPGIAITPWQIARTAAAWAVGVVPAYPRSNDLHPQLQHSPHEAARQAARALASDGVGPAPHGPVPYTWHLTWMQTYNQARATQAAFLRDIFPPPDYTPRLDPAWMTDTVLALARQMEQSDDYSAMPILADALEEAGCDDTVLLDHCRNPGAVHIRGNWVIDLLSGRL